MSETASAPAVTTSTTTAAPTGTTSTTTATPITPSAPTTTTDWTAGLPDLDRGYVQNKGWKAPADLLGGYQNLEKMVGVPAEQLVRLPKGDDKGEWDQVYSKLGRPGKAEDYKLPTSEKLGADPEFVKWAQGTFHEMGLTPKQAAGIVAKWNASQESKSETTLADYNRKTEGEQASLKKEWGLAHDQNIKVAQRAARELGLADEHFEALEKTLGFEKTIKLFHGIGTKTGESTFVTGDRASGVHKTPEAAQSELKMLSQDQDWVKKFVSGDSSARQEKERLERYAYPELQ